MFFVPLFQTTPRSRHLCNAEVESRCILTSGCVAKEQALVMVAETLGECGEFILCHGKFDPKQRTCSLPIIGLIYQHVDAM